MTSSYFTYSRPKVLQALRFHFFNRNEIKIMIIVVNIFAISSAVLYFTGKVGPLAFLMSSTLWFCLMLAFWLVLPIIIYRRATTFKDRFRVSFEDQHMFLENDRGSRSWPWKDFSTFVESSHFFHLYFDSRAFFLIPKTAFPKEDLHEIRKFLKEKIKK
ncbi:MAG: YcxB family protein [Ginsengibacter sp.]